jgi:hypothetical protein
MIPIFNMGYLRILPAQIQYSFAPVIHLEITASRPEVYQWNFHS